jgi:hypothetical protein
LYRFLHWSLYFSFSFILIVIIIFISSKFYFFLWKLATSSRGFPEMLESFMSSSTATQCWLLICTDLEPHFLLKTTGGVISKPPRETAD